MSSRPPRILIICGPTASGKSALAVQLAQQINGEVINADSMQIYRGMDIGTAKPTPVEQGGIPHHLLDIVDPDTPFSAADYAEAADRAISDIVKRGKRPIITGGTGLYIRALLHGLVDSPAASEQIRAQLQLQAAEQGNQALLEQLRLVDPQLADQLHPNNLVRVIRALEVHHLTGIPLSRHQQEHGFSPQRYRSLQIGIQVERSTLYQRIETRVDRMLENGLIDEVQALLAHGYDRGLKSLRAIGYKEIAALLAGDVDRAEALRLLKRNTRHYAKRQLTWFNADPQIIWLEYPEKFASISRYVIDFFDSEGDRTDGKGTV